MTKRLPVVAAIPNYNMGQQLEALLPELATQDYADIYVLDDASTDGSQEVVEAFNQGSGVQFVASRENRGAGATRNLIIGALGYDAVIHFLDADVTLKTERIPEVAHEVMPSESVAFVGGLLLTPEGIQSAWNYGPHQGFVSDIGANIQARIEPLLITNPDKARAIRARFNKLMQEWPDPLTVATRKQVFWNIEANLLVQSDVLAAEGGFDENLREHEIIDLAIRLHGRGLVGYFDPAISVQHKNEQNVREYNRLAEMLRAELYIARKHGFRSWLTSGR